MLVGRSVLIAAFVLGTSILPWAQEAATRKPVKNDPPSYPEMARKHNLTGSVKLEVVVNPNGTVKATKVLGGNPVLAAAAESSVKKWTYEPASGETTAVVTINFNAP